MSRIGKQPIEVPKGVEVNVSGSDIRVKGPKGEMHRTLSSDIKVIVDNNIITVDFTTEHRAIAGTSRSLINNMVIGVSAGYEKKLLIKGVGYRAQMQGRVLNLTLGLSHPVNHKAPEGITFETPSATEVVVKGVDKQLVGQEAANIRAYRPPEPYKGKGIRYADETIVRKETKKK